MSDDTYPFPDPLPCPEYGPPLTFKPTPFFGTSVWLNLLNVLIFPRLLMLRLHAYQKFLRDKEQDDLLRQVVAYQWNLKNHQAKTHHIAGLMNAARAADAEREEQKAAKLNSLEIDVLDGWAVYQLKRDYWGDLNPETIKDEFRVIVRRMPDAGLLRESTDEAVLAIVGDVAALPPPPPSPVLPPQQQFGRLYRVHAMLNETAPNPFQVAMKINDLEQRMGIGKSTEKREDPGSWIYLHMSASDRKKFGRD